MGILSEARMYLRFTRGLRGFLKQKISLDEARSIIQARVAERGTGFLRVLEHGMLKSNDSPYPALLKLADCEMGDLHGMVQADGLEATLCNLRESGVYITFEEFKGRDPIVRQGREIPVSARAFDNPFLQRWYYNETGGSTGAGARISTDLDYLADTAPNQMTGFHAHGILGSPTAVWYGILPDGTGLNNILRSTHHGTTPEKWFAYRPDRDFVSPLKFSLATDYILRMARFYGERFPTPEPASLDQAADVARWVMETLKSRGQCVLRTSVSRALRVSLAAREAGFDLTGATFLGGSEPPTPTKTAAIMQAGCRWISTYGFVEAGQVGMGCAAPESPDDVHLYTDIIALIQYPRQVPGSTRSVDSLHFTTLVPTAPKLMLNVELDDYALVEKRSCGCPLETLGLDTHLRNIRSFSKLTGEGVTLVGSDMEQILEHVLPSRFGGSALDYQLAEEEDEQGLTRLTLLVSPHLHISDESTVIATLLSELARCDFAAAFAGSAWKSAHTLRIRRANPVWTARGKLMPLHFGSVSDQPNRPSSG